MTEPNELENCTQCRYAVASQRQQAGIPEVGAVMYMCRHSPPVPILIPTGPQTANLTAQFPIVHDKMKCGRFEPQSKNGS